MTTPIGFMAPRPDGLMPASPPPDGAPALRDICGLLTIQADALPDEHASAQLEAALRTIDGTELGAALLRAIAACPIAADERPIVVFEDRDEEIDSITAIEESAARGDHVIYFQVDPPGASTARTSVDGEHPLTHDTQAEPGPGTASGMHPSADRPRDAAAPALPADAGHGADDAAHPMEQAIELFSDLAAFYASRIGQQRLAPNLGFGEFSTLTFREQLGDPIPQWQRDLDAHIRQAAERGEDLAGVWEVVNLWNYAGDTELPLYLNSMELRECPPLRNLPGLKWLIMIDNLLQEFPPSDRLPASLTTLDLAGNPIQTVADRYGPNLRRVILDRAMCEAHGLRDALPPEIELVAVEADYVADAFKAVEYIRAFPESLVDIVRVEDMERAGWSNDLMARLYPADMLEKAAAAWLAAPAADPASRAAASEPAPAPALDAQAWRAGQRADPNGAAALKALMNRLHHTWVQRPDPELRDSLVALLTRMQAEKRFMVECLDIARDGASSCSDNILHTLNSLHIALLNFSVEAGDYDDRLVELMYLAEDMMNMHTLAQYFAALRPELQARASRGNMPFDEVEQWLSLRTKLRGQVHMPAMQFNMQFDGLSLVEDADAERAKAAVAQARDGGFIDFLASWRPLQSVIRRIAPELAGRADNWRDHVYNDRGRVYRFLDTLLHTDGRLFASASRYDMEVFNVRPWIFWTRYERLVDKYLATRKLRRYTADVLPDACSAVTMDIHALIQKATVRDFLALHGLKLQQAIQDSSQPAWFQRLYRDRRHTPSGLALELSAVRRRRGLESTGEMLAKR